MIRKQRVLGREVTLGLTPLQAIQNFFGVSTEVDKEKPSIKRFGKMFAAERGDAWGEPTGIGFITSRFPRRLATKKDVAITPTPAPSPTKYITRDPVTEYYTSLRQRGKPYATVGRIPRKWEVRKILGRAGLPTEPYKVAVPTKKEAQIKKENAKNA